MTGGILALDLNGPAAAGRPNPRAARRWGGGARVCELRCDHCGTAYVHYVARAKRAKRHYCSQKCQHADRRGPANPNWRGGPATSTCQQCGLSFTLFQAEKRNGGGVYCSPKCLHDSQRIYPSPTIKARENGRRREVRQKAGAAIRTHTYKEWEACKQRHRHRCANCRTRRRLTRDHIVPLSRGGHDGIENIQPLCHSCNARKGSKLWLLC